MSWHNASAVRVSEFAAQFVSWFGAEPNGWFGGEVGAVSHLRFTRAKPQTTRRLNSLPSLFRGLEPNRWFGGERFHKIRGFKSPNHKSKPPKEFVGWLVFQDRLLKRPVSLDADFSCYK